MLALLPFYCGPNNLFRCQPWMLSLHVQGFTWSSCHFHVPRYQGSLFCFYFYLLFLFPLFFLRLQSVMHVRGAETSYIRAGKQ